MMCLEYQTSCLQTHLCEKDAESKYDIRNDTSRNDQGTLGNGAVFQEVRILRIKFALWIIVREGNIATQRNCAKRILYFFSLQRGAADKSSACVERIPGYSRTQSTVMR